MMDRVTINRRSVMMRLTTVPWREAWFPVHEAADVAA